MQTQTSQDKPVTYRLAFPAAMSPRDRTMWLAEVANKHRNLSVKPKVTVKSIIAVTQDIDTLRFLTEVGHPHNDDIIRLEEITEENKRTKVFIRNYPACLPLSYIQHLPSVLWCERIVRRDTNTNRNHAIAMWEGEVPDYLRLPGIKSCKIERYVGKPTFCGKCQRWGHRQWQCDSGRTICGFCSGQHDTSVCKGKLQKGEEVTHCCPNCSGPHNAWSWRCPKRPGSTLHLEGEIPHQPTATIPSPHIAPPMPSRGTTSLPRPPTQLPPPLSSYPPLSRPQQPNSGHHTSPGPLTPGTQESTLPSLHRETCRHSPPPPLQPTSTQDHTASPAPASVSAAKVPSTTLQEEIESLRQEVRSLKTTQEKLERENQDLRSLVISLQTTEKEVKEEIGNVKGELSSMKALLTQLVSLTKAQLQVQEAPSIPMDAEESQSTPQLTQPSPTTNILQEKREGQDTTTSNPAVEVMKVTEQPTPNPTHPTKPPTTSKSTRVERHHLPRNNGETQ